MLSIKDHPQSKYKPVLDHGAHSDATTMMFITCLAKGGGLFSTLVTFTASLLDCAFSFLGSAAGPLTASRLWALWKARLLSVVVGAGGVGESYEGGEYGLTAPRSCRGVFLGGGGGGDDQAVANALPDREVGDCALSVTTSAVIWFCGETLCGSLLAPSALLANISCRCCVAKKSKFLLILHAVWPNPLK